MIDKSIKAIREALEAALDEYPNENAGTARIVRQALTALDELEKRVSQQWRPIITAEDLPKKPGLSDYEQIDCLIVYKDEIRWQVWNCEHICWDDQDGDDFFCNPLEPTHWMPLPQPPDTTKE